MKEREGFPEKAKKKMLLSPETRLGLQLTGTYKLISMFQYVIHLLSFMQFVLLWNW